MEAIQGIQEIIDEHKEQMPTGVVKALYDKSKEAIENFPKLYKLTWTMVDSHAHVVEVEDGPSFANVKLSHKTQTFIVEQVDRDELNDRDDPIAHGFEIDAMELPSHGMVWKGWVDHFTKQPSIPMVLMPDTVMSTRYSEHMVIVNSIEPYEPRKRARSEG